MAIEIVAPENAWTAIDEQLWDEFLRTPTGRRVIPRLLESEPSNLSGGPTNEILIRSGEVRGFKTALATLIEMAHPDAKPQDEASSVSDNLPSLDDDSKWTDDNKPK